MIARSVARVVCLVVLCVGAVAGWGLAAGGAPPSVGATASPATTTPAAEMPSFGEQAPAEPDAADRVSTGLTVIILLVVALAFFLSGSLWGHSRAVQGGSSGLFLITLFVAIVEIPTQVGIMIGWAPVESSIFYTEPEASELLDTADAPPNTTTPPQMAPSRKGGNGPSGESPEGTTRFHDAETRAPRNWHLDGIAPTITPQQTSEEAGFTPAPTSEVSVSYSLVKPEDAQKLRSSDPVERAQAAYNIGSCGDNAVPWIPTLIELLGDTSGVRMHRVLSPYVVSEFGEPMTVGEVVAEALGDLRKYAMEPLINALATHNLATVRANAATALAHTKDRRCIEPLAAVLERNEADSVKVSAAFALAGFKDHRATRPLADLILRWDFPSDRVEEAAKLLRDAGDPNAVDLLAVGLQNVQDRVRSNAATALGIVGSSRALPALMTALREDKGVRYPATWSETEHDICWALHQITGRDFHDNGQKWLDWWQQSGEKWTE